MKKIAELIDSCNDCKHLIIADNRKESKSNFAICGLNKNEHKIIADSQTTDILSYNLEIPNFCGLETYTENNQN